TSHPSTLSLHDALPISRRPGPKGPRAVLAGGTGLGGAPVLSAWPARVVHSQGRSVRTRSRADHRGRARPARRPAPLAAVLSEPRSEEHTSELQSPDHHV